MPVKANKLLHYYHSRNYMKSTFTSPDLIIVIKTAEAPTSKRLVVIDSVHGITRRVRKTIPLSLQEVIALKQSLEKLIKDSEEFS